MSFLSYKLFTYLNIFIGALLVILPWVISKSVAGNVVTVVLGLILIAALIFSKNNGVTKLEYLDNRLTLLIVFVSTVILNFAPYIFNFTNESNLVWLVFGSSAVTLLSLIFTKFIVHED